MHYSTVGFNDIHMTFVKFDNVKLTVELKLRNDKRMYVFEWRAVASGSPPQLPIQSVVAVHTVLIGDHLVTVWELQL